MIGVDSSKMELPDLSHLTKEEQATILKVIQRQQDEEAKEKAMMKTLQEQFENYKVQVKKAETAALELKQSPEEIKDLCALCHKTKIAEGCGHSCSYCSATFCSRCGGRVVVRSDKNERMVTWVCTLCRKQHELLKKTGAWYRTEQNRSTFSLKLEPMPKHDVGKLTGSVSLAQLESNSLSKDKSRGRHAARLRKGSSEPQLTNCEKSLDVLPNQIQPSEAIEHSNSPTSKKKTEEPATKDTHPISFSSSKHETLEPDTLSEELARHQKTSEAEKQKFPSNIEKNGDVISSVKNEAKSTVEGPPNHQVPKEAPSSNHGENSCREQSRLNAPSFNGGGDSCSPHSRTRQNAKPASLSISQNVPDRRPSFTSVVTDDRQSVPSSKSRKLNMLTDEAQFQLPPAGNSLTNYEWSSRGGSTLSATNSVGNVSNSPRTTLPNVQGLTHTHRKHPSHHDEPSSKRRTPDNNTTEVDSKTYIENARDHLPHPPRSNHSTPRLLHSPVAGQRHCRRHSPMLSHEELHDALSNHKYCDGSHAHRQGHHRTNSPSRKEIPKSTRHTARCKDCLSDNDGAEYTHRLHQPVRKHHRSSSSCLDEGRSHWESNYCGKGNGTHPSMIAFDDVSLHSCSSPCRREQCCHFCNNASGRYHSDLNLPRSSCTNSSEGTISSTGRISHVANCPQSKRRSNSKHGSDYQLQMSHFRKHQRQKGRTGKHLRRKPSLSSTDDEIQSTPDYSSCEESEKKIGTGIYKGDHNQRKALDDLPQAERLLLVSSPWYRNLSDFAALLDEPRQGSTDSGKDLSKKVHFDQIAAPQRRTKNDLSQCNTSPLSNTTVDHDSPDVVNTTRNFSIRTGSSINTVVHSHVVAKDQAGQPYYAKTVKLPCDNRQILTQQAFNKTQPVSWQPSSDGTCLVGRMVLNKGGSTFAKSPNKEPSSGVLGVKVVGGKPNEAGELGAYVSMVKKGSVADTTGHLKKGDEVIMWNNHCLRGASYEDVCKAILDSKSHKTVSLVVCRPILNMPRVPEARWRHPATESSSSSFESQKREDEAIVAARGPAQLQSSPRVNDEPSMQYRNEIPPGKLQVSIWHDQATQQLYVSVQQAVDLPYRPGNLMRNPYIKMYLLPDRSEVSRRRTKTVKKSINPVWNQSFSYGGLRKQDLDSMSLELTLWDLDRSAETNGHFLGEVLIDLGLARIDDVPQWYKLMPPGEGINQAFHQTAMAHPYHDSHCSRTKVGNDNCHQRTPSQGEHQERSLGRNHRKTVSEANFSVLTNEQQPYTTLKKSLYSGSLPSSSHYLTQDGNSTSPRPRAKHGSYRNDSPLKSNHTPSGHHGFERTSQPDSIKTQLKQEKRILDNPTSGEENSRVLPSIEHLRQSTSSKQGPHNSDTLPNSSKAFDQISEMINKDPSLLDSRATKSAKVERTRRLSVDNVDSGSTSGKVTDDTLSKSISLSANLHAPNKPRNFGSKSASSSNQTSPHSKNSSPSGRKGNNNFFAQKLLVGLKNRSQSSSTLEGNKQKAAASSTRCSEFGVHPTLQKDGSRGGSASGSVQSLVSEGSGRSVDRTLKDFIGGLGVGQVAGRQTLAASTLGKIQLAISDTGAGLKVEVERAEGLVLKPGAKAPPAVHVKVYLMFEKQCIAKRKTKTALKLRNPEFRQSVRFEPNQYGNSLQVVVWGDYGRLDSKSFMGMAQIKILGSDQPSKQEGWYTLFPTSSMLEISLLDNLTGSKTSLENHTSGFFG